MRQWWIEEPRLLATGNPTDEELDDLRRKGFTQIVSLLEDDKERPRYDTTRQRNAGWTRCSIPIAEGGTPSDDQLDRFVKLITDVPARAKAIVHCQTGGSRTAVMAVAYWLHAGVPLAEARKRLPSDLDRDIQTPERQGALDRFAARVAAKISTRKPT